MISYPGAVPDDLFALSRLARIYDELDGSRDDLALYRAVLDEVHGRSVLDVGCGTGTFACALALSALKACGLDPAAASLDVARGKPGADEVRWLHAPATEIPAIGCDAVTMTGNVAQVFLDDAEWAQVLTAVRATLRPGGWIVFEALEPSARAWERWTEAETRAEFETKTAGRVEHWTELTRVALPLVSFRHHYLFQRDQTRLTSSSTLRFRSRDEFERSLAAAGFEEISVRDAPDRPGKENVFVARARPQPQLVSG